MRRKLFPKHRPALPAQNSVVLAKIFEELKSPDEKVRAEAVRKLCPCRGNAWEVPVFPRVIELRRDPSPVVRHAVEHDLSENPGWGRRSEDRKMQGRRVKQEEREVRAEIEALIDRATEENTPLPPSSSLGWRTLPRRRKRKKHRLM